MTHEVLKKHETALKEIKLLYKETVNIIKQDKIVLKTKQQTLSNIKHLIMQCDEMLSQNRIQVISKLCSPDIIIDLFGNKVLVTRDENGCLNYEFNPKYKGKKLKKVQKAFFKEAAPVLEAMNESEEGFRYIQKMQNIPTKINIIAQENILPKEDVNSHVNVDISRLDKDGYYYDAIITPYFKQYEAVGSTADFEEWLSAVILVEVEHLMPRQIQKELKGYSKNPKDPAFTSSYQTLLNKAVELRIKYRLEKGQEITEEVFAPIEVPNSKGAKIKYNEYTKKHRDEFLHKK